MISPLVNNIFLYLTEHCNLYCDYCYFKDKRGRRLDPLIIRTFLEFIKNNLKLKPNNFELSGGEPLSCWPLTQSTIKYIKEQFWGSAVNVQTNGIFLDKEKIFFLSRHNVSLEIGIDGRFLSTSRHRKGLKSDQFRRLTRNIKHCLKNNLKVSCTMTIHPQEVEKLEDNFIFLSGLGIKNIDITPAAFKKWDGRKLERFQDNYCNLLKQSNRLKPLFIEEDTNFLRRFYIDLSLHPGNYVFCGDAYLCLPEAKRKEYSIFDFSAKKIFREDKFIWYVKSYKDCLKRLSKPLTYRDYVSAGFMIISKMLKGREADFRTMIRFHNFLKLMNLKLYRDNLHLRPNQPHR